MLVKHNAEIPYNELPLLPPKTDIENKPILKSCILARTALAALKEAGQLIPNQSVLINTIPLLEAKVSSEIENVVTTMDKLFRCVSGNDRNADSATKETYRYRQALAQGSDLIKKGKPICTSMAAELCSIILSRPIHVRKTEGTVLSNPLIGEIIYTPPTGESVILEKLSNWEQFVNEQIHLDPLIRMAVMHYQFEAIHPFADGNGRTGRLLNILLLIQEGLLDRPVLYLSRYLINHRREYYQLLRAVTEQQTWQDWILFLLEAVRETAYWTCEKIHAIRDLLEHTCQYIQNSLPKIYSRELVDLIFIQPYCRISNVVDCGIAKRQTASVYLKQLADIGVLDEVREGRERLFLHPKYLELLKQDNHQFREYLKT